jgi:hypothetical protein
MNQNEEKQIVIRDADKSRCISDHDLALLADWANMQKFKTDDQKWRRAFALIREGADLLLRRRAALTSDQSNSQGKKNDTDSH